MHVNRIRPLGRGHRVSTARLARAGAGLVAVATLATGCGVIDDAGTAARVGDTRITEQRLQKLTNQLADAGITTDASTGAALGPGDAQRSTLEKLIAGALIKQAAKEHKVTLTDGELDTFSATFNQQLQGSFKDINDYVVKSRAVPPGYARQYVRDVLLTDKLETKLAPTAAADDTATRTAALNKVLLQVERRAGVEVNPRYGTWTLKQGSVQQLISGGLSHPASDQS